jgi:hypothetical protein
MAGLVSLVRTSPMHLLCTSATKRQVQVVASVLRHVKDEQGTTIGSKNLHVEWIRDKT